MLRSDILPTLIHFRNSVIEYVPIPITDIVLMKITEKDRMEKLQSLINKVNDLVCLIALILFFSPRFSLICFAIEIINVRRLSHHLILSMLQQPLILLVKCTVLMKINNNYLLIKHLLNIFSLVQIEQIKKMKKYIRF